VWNECPPFLSPLIISKPIWAARPTIFRAVLHSPLCLCLKTADFLRAHRFFPLLPLRHRFFPPRRVFCSAKDSPHTVSLTFAVCGRCMSVTVLSLLPSFHDWRVPFSRRHAAAGTWLRNASPFFLRANFFELFPSAPASHIDVVHAISSPLLRPF